MTCNHYKVPPMTRAESSQAMGWGPPPTPEEFRPRGMSDAQFAKWATALQAQWDADEAEHMASDPAPAFACGEKLIIPVCKCGVAADYLCDYPIGKGNTCDLNLCDRCRFVAGDDLDLCAIHRAEFMRKAGVERINSWPPPRKGVPR